MLIVFPLLFVACPMHAAMTALDDNELSDVSGGLGIILNEVEFIGDPNASIQLTFDTSLGSDAGFIDHIALFGSNSSAACRANPTTAACEGFTVGNINNPGSVNDRINLDVVTDVGANAGSDITYIELRWPTTSIGEPTGFDLQFRVVTTGIANTANGDSARPYADSFFADSTWWKIQNVKLEDTWLRAWGSGPLRSSVKYVNPITGVPDNARQFNDGDNLGVVFAGMLNLSFDLEASVASAVGVREDEPYRKFPGGGSGTNSPSTNPASIIRLSDARIENLSLGFYPYLPLSFGSIAPTVAGEAPNFYLEMPSLPNDPTILAAFYNRTINPKANISIQQITLGVDGTASPAPFNFGHSTVSSQSAFEVNGLNIQHLRIQTCGNGDAGCI